MLPPKLIGASNYTNWSSRLKFYLMGLDLWDVITGRLRPSMVSEKQPTDSSVTYVAPSEFRRKDQQAMAILVGRLSNDVFPVVQHLTENDQRGWSKAAWDALDATYAERGFNYKAQLIVELATLTSGSFSDVQAYANHHLELCRRIVDLGGLSLEDFSPAVFLNGLGTQYSLWATGARSRARKDGPPQVPDLLAELVDEERLVNRESTTSVALLTKQKQTRPQQKCTGCGKRSHTATHCWRLHPELRPRTTKASGSQPQIPGNQSDRPPGGRTTSFSLLGINKETVNSIALPALGLSDQWFIDNGANSHSFCGPKEAFSSYRTIPPGRSVEGIGGAVQVLGIGDITLHARLTSGAVNLLKLSAVQHTPGLPASLISGRLLSQRGYDFSLISGQLSHPGSGAILAETFNVRGLYALKLIEPQSTAYLTASNNASADLWHRRLGHIPYQRLKVLAKQLKIQLPEETLSTCHTCQVANIQRGVNYTPKTRATGIGDKIHGDLVGPISPPGKGGYRYFLLLTDDRTRERWIYHLRHKSEALSYLQQHYQLIRTQANRAIKAYGLDGGTELANSATKHWVASQGISLEFITRSTPESNGVSERSNGLVERMARALINGAPGVETAWWPEATRAAVYLLNRLPSSSLRTHTPLDVFSWLVNGDGSKSDDYFTNYRGLRVWGCCVTCHIP